MTTSTTRLHISPLTPALLDSVLAPSARNAATEISFHSIPTFPENDYGYVTLPTTDADKLKKKLNGSILRGRKFRIEEARPKTSAPENETIEMPSSADNDRSSPVPQTVSKKRKADGVTLSGYELPSGRLVKRGWTEPTKKERRQHKKDKTKKTKIQPSSKYTDKEECLFRTNCPPNRTDPAEVEKKKAKKNKKPTDVVVHEFEKSVAHPSFIRSSDAGASGFTSEFVEGKGWVDRDGKVKETASEKLIKNEYSRPGMNGTAVPGKSDRKRKTAAATKKQPSREPSADEHDEDDETSSSGTSSDDEDTSSEGSSDLEGDSVSVSSDSISSKSVSDSGSSSEDLMDEEEAAPMRQSSTPEPTPIVQLTPLKGPSNAEDKDKATTTPDAVHPLEELFKRPAPTSSTERRPLEINTSFSFFGAGNNDDIDEDMHDAKSSAGNSYQEPQTPFTKRDMQMRGMRSAALTPDTAAPARIAFWQGDDELADGEEGYEYYDDDDDGLGKKGSNAAAPKTTGEESKFAAWFWEHRGENNRAWKKRRRDAAKEQRQRENRRKGTKGR